MIPGSVGVMGTGVVVMVCVVEVSYIDWLVICIVYSWVAKYVLKTQPLNYMTEDVVVTVPFT